MEERPMSTSDIAHTQGDPMVEKDAVSEDRPDGRFQRADGGAASATWEPLLSDNDSSDMKHRWEEIQTTFVDEPRGAVERADQLVAMVMKQIADGFARERSDLERQWGQGEDVSTEDLRVALQRYRSFFERLLSA